MATINRGILWTLFQFGSIYMISTVLGWDSSEKIKLTDVDVITLYQGKMTNARRTHPDPQFQCVGGSAGCSAFTPQVVQCYNRGSNGHEVQWQCNTTGMDSCKYRFGEIAVNCEGYSYPDDPYVLKGSCGLEYYLDVVGRGHCHSRSDSGHRNRGYHAHHDNYNTGGTTLTLINAFWQLPSGVSWFVSIIMCGIIACVVYYLSQWWTSNANTLTPGGYTQSSRPPPAGFRPGYVPDSTPASELSSTKEVKATSSTDLTQIQPLPASGMSSTKEVKAPSCTDSMQIQPLPASSMSSTKEVKAPSCTDLMPTEPLSSLHEKVVTKPIADLMPTEPLSSFHKKVVTKPITGFQTITTVRFIASDVKSEVICCDTSSMSSVCMPAVYVRDPWMSSTSWADLLRRMMRSPIETFADLMWGIMRSLIELSTAMALNGPNLNSSSVMAWSGPNLNSSSGLGRPMIT